LILEGLLSMLRKSSILGTISLCGFLGAGLVLHSVTAALAASNVISKHDKDSDKTLDLAEVKAAASAQFDKLNKDSDDTLDSKEVKGVLGKKEFKAADPDNDGTLTKDEYLAIVEKLFKKADLNNDGTLNAKELKSKAGRALTRLID
jgi:hypothetical protein